ncbi:glycerol-3-phosphate 1-O-acyltransferase PlsY [Bartonella sp. DGB1]|uniref:glycerol-3-phosphate 1-O-acyltransferase PlsY n=1 Tax=Bartonella sp. DGB1 TaxID=3239807 RepID=UPI00352445DE
MTDNIVFIYPSIAIIGYILGSIPFGLLLTKFFIGTDVRDIGSGNIGATNVLRTGNKFLAMLTLLLDAFKGYLSIIIIEYYFNSNLALIAGFFTFLGHLYPVWLNFKGGKGVATYFGILFAIAPFIALLFTIIWIITLAISCYSSLSALLATLFAPIPFLLLQTNIISIMFIVMTLLIYLRHKDNIIRLARGEEKKSFHNKI